MPNPYLALVPKPPAMSVNSGLSASTNKLMLGLFGAPSNKKTRDCGPVTNPQLKRALVTRSVGPFRVTGHRAAVNSLEQILAAVKAKEPQLYAMLGSAGMLCCRLVRGSTSSWSNHSWGFAIDITVGGELDQRGDDQVLAGMLALYKYFHAAGWYWGVEFPIEDAMHFEVAAETLKTWHAEGKL